MAARLPIYGTPLALADGSAIFASVDGTVARVDARGRISWRRSLGATIFSSPALSAGRVLVGTDADILWCLDAVTGKPLWHRRVGSCRLVPGAGPESVRCDADASPAVVGDAVYLTADALYVFGLRRGRIRRRTPLVAHAHSSPAVARDGTVYFGTQAAPRTWRRPRKSGRVDQGPSSTSNAIHAVGRDGHLRWVLRARWHCDATPAVTSETVYVGCDDRQLYAIDRSSGKLRWELKTRGAIRSSAAVAKDGTVLVGSYDRRLYAVRPDGQLAWRYLTGGPIHSSPTVDPSGSLVFGSRDDHVYALDASGKLLWRLRLGGDVDSSVVVGRALMLVGADDGYLYALER